MTHSIGFEIESNNELLELFDKSLEYVYISRFNPHEIIEWWETSLQIESKVLDLRVRNMEFDIQLKLDEIEQILDIKTNQLDIFQLDKPLPDSLVLEKLPKETQFKILIENGMKHWFCIEFEHVSVISIDESFIDKVRESRID